MRRRPRLHDTHRSIIDKIPEPQHILSTGEIKVEHFVHTNLAQPPLTRQLRPGGWGRPWSTCLLIVACMPARRRRRRRPCLSRQ